MISSYEYSCLASALSEEREEVRLPVGRMETTVDWQNHSIDEDGVFTSEKCNHTRDIVWCGGPTDWESVTKSGRYCFIFLEIGSGLRRGETRSHGVDAYATRAVLERQGAREVRHAALRRVICTNPPISA